ncbi:hypothetical protein J6590_050329 [Homalodisca vitripennis]|nr:hypothetical protein J6590_050329 [Homalodisca vitripennis]
MPERWKVADRTESRYREETQQYRNLLLSPSHCTALTSGAGTVAGKVESGEQNREQNPWESTATSSAGARVIDPAV